MMLDVCRDGDIAREVGIIPERVVRMTEEYRAGIFLTCRLSYEVAIVHSN